MQHQHQQQQQQQQGSCSSVYRNCNTHHSATDDIRMSQLTACGVLPTAVNLNGWVEKEEQQFDLGSRDYLQLQSSEYGTLNCHLVTAASGVFHQWDNEKDDLGGYEKSISMSGDWRPSPPHHGDPYTSIGGHDGVEDFHLQHHRRADGTKSTSTMTSFPAFCPSTTGDICVRLQSMETGSCLTEYNDKTSGDVSVPPLTSEHVTVAQHRAWELGASPSNNACRPLTSDAVQLRSPERFSTCANHVENISESNRFRNTSIFGGVGARTVNDYELSGMSAWPECGYNYCPPPANLNDDVRGSCFMTSSIDASVVRGWKDISLFFGNSVPV